MYTIVTARRLFPGSGMGADSPSPCTPPGVLHYMCIHTKFSEGKWEKMIVRGKAQRKILRIWPRRDPLGPTQGTHGDVPVHFIRPSSPPQTGLGRGPLSRTDFAHLRSADPTRTGAHQQRPSRGDGTWRRRVAPRAVPRRADPRPERLGPRVPPATKLSNLGRVGAFSMRMYKLHAGSTYIQYVYVCTHLHLHVYCNYIFECARQS